MGFVHVELPRELGVRLRGASDPPASRCRVRRCPPAPAIGRRDPRWPRSRACSPACRAWPPLGRWPTRWPSPSPPRRSAANRREKLVALRLRGCQRWRRVPLAVDHGRDPQFSHEAVAPLSLRDRAGSGSVAVHRLAVTAAPQVPSARCAQLGTVRCVCNCGSTVTMPVAGSVTGRAVRARLGHHQVRAHRFRALWSGGNAAPSRRAPGGTRRRHARPRRGCAGWSRECGHRRARRGCSRPWVRTPQRRRRPRAGATSGVPDPPR